MLAAIPALTLGSAGTSASQAPSEPPHRATSPTDTVHRRYHSAPRKPLSQAPLLPRRPERPPTPHEPGGVGVVADLVTGTHPNRAWEKGKTQHSSGLQQQQKQHVNHTTCSHQTGLTPRWIQLGTLPTIGQLAAGQLSHRSALPGRPTDLTGRATTDPTFRNQRSPIQPPRPIPLRPLHRGLPRPPTGRTHHQPVNTSRPPAPPLHLRGR